MSDQETRKRLLINRHIAKMSPEEIARRFVTEYTAPLATGVRPSKATSTKPAAIRVHPAPST